MGTQHQAGSDSLVTAAAYFRLKEQYYKSKQRELEETRNVLFGLESQPNFRGMPGWDAKFVPSYPRYYGVYAYQAQEQYAADGRKSCDEDEATRLSREEGKVSHADDRNVIA